MVKINRRHGSQALGLPDYADPWAISIVNISKNHTPATSWLLYPDIIGNHILQNKYIYTHYPVPTQRLNRRIKLSAPELMHHCNRLQ